MRSTRSSRKEPHKYCPDGRRHVWMKIAFGGRWGVLPDSSTIQCLMCEQFVTREIFDRLMSESSDDQV